MDAGTTIDMGGGGYSSVVVHVPVQNIKYITKVFHSNNPAITEALTCYVAIQTALHLQGPTVIESDSLSVVQAIYKQKNPPWRIAAIICDCQSLPPSSNVVIMYIPRRENSIAHQLAKFAVQCKQESSWLPPGFHPCISKCSMKY